MSYSSEMLEAAALARPELREGADDVRGFVRSRAMPDGGFKGRGADSDLYYTVFGLDCMMAMGEQPDLEQTATFLAKSGDGDGLDLIHLGCLARCWTRLGLKGLSDSDARTILARVEKYRSRDGGYSIEQDAGNGSIYGCFLAYAAYQDLDSSIPEPESMADSVEALRMDDGFFTSEIGLQKATVNAAVGAILLLGDLGRPVAGPVSEWLLAQCHEKGGFLAAPGVPVPDLVSTATALFALRRVGVALDGVKKSCINFVGSVWDDNGGFAGHWLDDTVDCEYTFYALLSLGCLVGSASV
ncbi:prenyltransferase/squalene oxidase repeat-containing protein [Verrucomicrobiota bacterium]